MKRIFISRIYQNEHKTLSECFVNEGFTTMYGALLSFVAVELPWRDNQRGISCIPAQVYEAEAIFRHSRRHLSDDDIRKYGIWLKDVPQRSGIVIHIANFVRQLEGCIAPGTNFRDLDNDGVLDVENSGQALTRLREILPVGEICEVHVIDAFKYNRNIPPDASLIA